MNKKSLARLAIMVLALMMILVIMQVMDRENYPARERLLFPQLKSRINRVDSLTIKLPRDDSPTIIHQASGVWSVSSRNDYPADIGKIRQLLMALGDANIAEEKTANPDDYNQLGVQDPEVSGSKAVSLAVTGPDFHYDLLLGNSAQGSYRYVRVTGDATTWLINKNPDIPKTAGQWLQPDIINIDVARVKSVSISQLDAESLRIAKKDAGDEAFEVATMPEGRQLRYATVVNGIAGVMHDLRLEDVRKAEPFDSPTITVFETFDGIEIIVKSLKIDQEAWISLEATSNADNHEEIDAINDRVQGWQYRISTYNADQLTRRWDDILQPVAE